jgi:hypothetical protein
MKNVLSFGEGTIFEEGYGFSPKKIMRDPSVSIELKGFYAYIASYSGNGKTAWPGTKRMMQELGIGKNRLFRLIKEAQEKGLIRVDKVRNNKGQFTNNQYSLVIKPAKAQLKPCLHSPDTGSPDTGSPDTGTGDTNSNITNSNITISNNSNILPGNKEPKHNYAEFVKLTETEYNKLIDRYGKEKSKRMIEVLDNYKGANGKKYKSDYRAILSWVVDRVQKEMKPRKAPRAFQSLKEWIEDD